MKILFLSFWWRETKNTKFFSPSLDQAAVEAEGPWQIGKPKPHWPISHWFLQDPLHSQPSTRSIPPALTVQLFLAGKHILTLSRLTPLAKPNSEAFANLLGSQRTVKMEQRFVWFNVIVGRQGRKRGAGKNKCLMFRVDTAALFADGGLLSQGGARLLSMPLYSTSGEKQGAQCGHLSLSIWCCLTHHPPLCLSFPVALQQLPRKSIPLTPDLPGCETPKTQGRNSNYAGSASILNSPSSQRFSGRISPAPGWSPSPHFPPQVLHQQLLPILVHQEQAPAQTKAEECNCCVPSPSKGHSSPSLWTLRFWELPKPGNFKALQQLWEKKKKKDVRMFQNYINFGVSIHL